MTGKTEKHCLKILSILIPKAVQIQNQVAANVASIGGLPVD
jgi:hypothetical protein